MRVQRFCVEIFFATLFWGLLPTTKAGGLPVVSWWFGGFSVVSLWCLGGVLVVSWWRLGGVLVAYRWCLGDVSEVSRWFVGGVSVVPWWCLGGISEVSCRRYAGVLLFVGVNEGAEESWRPTSKPSKSVWGVQREVKSVSKKFPNQKPVFVAFVAQAAREICESVISRAL
eukprot:s2270_g6.t1